MATNGLKKYQALKKRAARKGIVVPRGTNMVELEALLEGKVARCVTTPAKAPAKKAPAKKAPAKKAPAPSRTPTASATRKRRTNTTRGGQGSLFGFD